jgi:hypothetical protein
MRRLSTTMFVFAAMPLVAWLKALNIAPLDNCAAG